MDDVIGYDEKQWKAHVPDYRYCRIIYKDCWLKKDFDCYTVPHHFKKVVYFPYIHSVSFYEVHNLLYRSKLPNEILTERLNLTNILLKPVIEDI